MSGPGLLEKIALPYALALLESVQVANLLKKTNEDLNIISGMLLASDDLKAFLENPLVTTLAKKNVIKQLLSEQVSNTVLTFLFVLVDRRRIGLLNIIVDRYFELAYKLESTTIANITTSIALTDLQHDNLVAKLQEITKTKNVKLVVQIDPNLIGGFTIQIGSKVIDTSLYGKLNQIASYLNMA
uniref:ATP synthase CF1 delta subunit n=1 Tax=Ahnfeltia fastigiata TaxID=31363 RepID=UPI001D11A91D|nr:ATP synthase CF1 delta subunit [Ahnfeltia fastigiata]UAT97608.1 ATP synthase CF1 delta subunit [Ahnfeltia fastigiata]